MTEEKKENTWLEKLQENSWQIELVIAGGIVYTLYQLPDYFRRYFLVTYESSYLSDTILLSLIVSYLLTRLLLIGFMFNLVLRAVWVAFIGIYATFPKGLNYENKYLSDWMKHNYPEPIPYKKRLDTLERWCNLSYSLAILLCLISISVFLLMWGISYLISQIPFYSFLDEAWFKYFLVGIFIFLVLGTLERLVFRVTRKSVKLQRFLSYFFKFFDYLSLSFLFKKEWTVLLSNFKTWKIQGLLIIYFSLGLVITINQIGSYLNIDGFFSFDPLDKRDYKDIPAYAEVKFHRYYNKLPEKKSFSLQGCISSDIVDGRYLWVFVSYWDRMDYMLGKNFEKYDMPLVEDEIDGREQWKRVDSLFKKSLNETFHVTINEKLRENLGWYKHQLTKTGEHGFIAYIDVNDLTPGEYLLEVQRQGERDNGEHFYYSWFRAPFWRE